jgi:hypothetical protein
VKHPSNTTPKTAGPTQEIERHQSQTRPLTASGPPTPSQPNIFDITTIPGLSFVAEATHLKSALIQQFNLQVEHSSALASSPSATSATSASITGIDQQHQSTQAIQRHHQSWWISASPRCDFRDPVSNTVNLEGVSYVASEGISNYNGLQTSFQRRFSKGSHSMPTTPGPRR